MIGDYMVKKGRSRRTGKYLWGNRMAILGITFVVLSLAVIVTIKGGTLKEKEREYELRLEALKTQEADEEERSQKLEEYRIYVQTRQYIEEVAKQKLGLVNPGEILLKPSRKQ